MSGVRILDVVFDSSSYTIYECYEWMNKYEIEYRKIIETEDCYRFVVGNNEDNEDTYHLRMDLGIYLFYMKD
jgi:hypothetical protein